MENVLDLSENEFKWYYIKNTFEFFLYKHYMK